MIAISDGWGVDESIVQAKKLVQWAERSGITEITLRELMRSNNRAFPDLDAIRGPLTILIENGWIRPADDEPISFVPKRGKPSPTLLFHPRLAEVIHRPIPDQTSCHTLSPTMRDNSQYDETVTETAKQCEVVTHVTHVTIRGESDNSLTLNKTTSPPPTPDDMHDMRDNPDDPLDLLD